MLNRLLLVVDALLIVAAALLGAQLYRVGMPKSAPTAPAPAPTSAATTTIPEAPPARPPLAAFAVVAERNLFSPTRAEVAPEPPKPSTPATPPAPALPKPRLYGILLGPDQSSRAYLEDPRTRRVFGYRIGDSVADSKVEEIRADRVVLRRGGEVYEVLLRDPSKPRPVAVPTPAQNPLLQLFPGAAQPPAPGVSGQPPGPGAETPQSPQPQEGQTPRPGGARGRGSVPGVIGAPTDANQPGAQQP